MTTGLHRGAGGSCSGPVYPGISSNVAAEITDTQDVGQVVVGGCLSPKTGNAQPSADGLTHIVLDGGGSVSSIDAGRGPVAVSVYPWEIALDAPEAQPTGSAQNHVAAEVTSVTAVGNRIRVGLWTVQWLGMMGYFAHRLLRAEQPSRVEAEKPSTGSQGARRWVEARS